jgi:hypothetical protein
MRRLPPLRPSLPARGAVRDFRVRTKTLAFISQYPESRMCIDLANNRANASQDILSLIHLRVGFPYRLALIVIKTELAAHPVGNHCLEGGGNLRHAVFDLASQRRGVSNCVCVHATEQLPCLLALFPELEAVRHIVEIEPPPPHDNIRGAEYFD